ncbi:AMP-binding protein [Nocardia sp. SYP-A9097]|nr:AMP-binding protein [Nocardia sp. SYP-A9097]
MDPSAVIDTTSPAADSGVTAEQPLVIPARFRPGSTSGALQQDSVDFGRKHAGMTGRCGPTADADSAASDAGRASVSDVLLAAAARSGSAVAVIDAEGEHSFTEFGAAVSTLATHLRAHGLRPGDAVAVVLPRDRRVLHAPFAIAHAGGVCVHVDPGTPPDRLAYLLESSGARLVLGAEDLVDVLVQVRAQGVDFAHGVPTGTGELRFIGQAPAAADMPIALPIALPATPFYVIFTSGTTGRPKGVVVPHGALLSHWANHERRIFAPAAERIGRQLRIGHGWSTGFDAAWQPTVALLSGHTVVMLGEHARTDAEQIAAAVTRHGIDIFDTSPSMLPRLIAFGLFTERDGAEHCPLAVLALGGEAIDPDTWRRLSALPDTRVINFYGPTETTVEALMADVHEHDSPTIGRTFDRMTAEILDHRLRPVPPGGLGELYLSGPQLALGYLGRPATTAAAFVAGTDGRRYRTGDLVRRATDGTVVYEGRIDSQVKINGYRVEPDEAAVVLRELDGVEHAAVLAYTGNGRTRLGALVVSEVPVPQLRAALAQRLPRFLVPTRIVPVGEIPLNRNDKLDVHAATTLLTAPVAGSGGGAPATETERTLLGVIAAHGAAGSAPAITDSLVDLGIDSIGVIDLVSRLRGAGFRIAARDVLAAGDLRDLAARLDELVAAGEERAAAEITPAGTLLPLTALAREIIGNGGYRYLAQSQVISLPDDVSVAAIADRVSALATAHPTLRSRLVAEVDGHALRVEELPPHPVWLRESDGTGSPATYLTDTVARLDPEAGLMLAVTILSGPQRRLLLSIHHLAVDVVSWLILVDDLRRLEQGHPPLNEEPFGEPDTAAITSGTEILGTPLAGRLTDPAQDRAGKVTQRVVELGPEHTEQLLAACAQATLPLEDALILACARTFPDIADAGGRVAITRESHGRPDDDDTRRVGWFTVEETVLVPGSPADWTPGATSAGLFDRDAVADGSQGARPDLSERTFSARGQLRINHLGRFDVLQFGSGSWSPAPLSEFTGEFGVAAHPDLPLRFSVDITTAVVPRDGRPSLVAQFDVNTAVLDGLAVDARAERWAAVLAEFAGVRAG